MTTRDRSVVGGLSALLAVLVLAMLWPSVVPAAGGPGSSADPSASAADPSQSAAPTVEAGLLREGILSRPTAISPFGARTQADRDLVSLVFAGLVRLGPGDTYLPDLAESWTVDATGATWTFKMRSDARWHDGVPVTADDVVFTYKSLQDPEYTGPGNGSWSEVTVEAIDTATVRFTLKTPLGGFLGAFSQPIAPAHLLDGTPAADLPTLSFGQQPIGAGPYKVTALDAGAATLERVATAGVAGAPSTTADAPRHIAFRFFANPDELVAAYRAGELDAVSGLPAKTAADLGGDGRSHLLRYPRSTITSIVLNLRPDHPELRSAHARLALLEAIDRDRLVTTLLAGLGRRADSLIPMASWAFSATRSPVVKRDLTAAAKELTTAGWKKVKKAWVAPGKTAAYQIELISPDEASNPIAWGAAQAVAADWKAFGLTVELVGLPPTSFVDGRLRAAKFAAAAVDLTIGLDPDLYPLLASTQTVTGGSNISGVQDPGLDTRLEKARQPGTEAARRSAYASLQAYLAKQVLVLPLFVRDEVVVASDRLAGPVIREVGDPSDRFYDVLTWRLADDR